MKKNISNADVLKEIDEANAKANRDCDELLINFARAMININNKKKAGKKA